MLTDGRSEEPEGSKDIQPGQMSSLSLPYFFISIGITEARAILLT